MDVTPVLWYVPACLYSLLERAILVVVYWWVHRYVSTDDVIHRVGVRNVCTVEPSYGA